LYNKILIIEIKILIISWIIKLLANNKTEIGNARKNLETQGKTWKLNSKPIYNNLFAVSKNEIILRIDPAVLIIITLLFE